MDHLNKVEFRLSHHADVAELANHLLPLLECDDWYVACQHEHLLVLQFSKAGSHRYAVRIECTAPVEKGIFHGSKACSFSLLPLGGGGALSPEVVAGIKTSLGHLQ